MCLYQSQIAQVVQLKYYKYVLSNGENIMPGRIMTAQQAVKEYSRRFKSIKLSGNNVTLKNSMGIWNPNKQMVSGWCGRSRLFTWNQPRTDETNWP